MPTASVLHQIRPLQFVSTLRICYSQISLTVHQPNANLPTYKNGIELYSPLPSNIKLLNHYIKIFMPGLKFHLLANSFYSANFLKQKHIII